MKNPFYLTLARRDRLSAAEIEIIREISSHGQPFSAKSDIVVEGANPKLSCLMLSGFSARYHLLRDGRRQITAVHIAGDFVDLHSFLLSRMDHSVTALTDCEISLVSHAYIRDLTVSEPHFARLLWMTTTIDAAIYRQWLVAAGRLSPTSQIAHFILEMYMRLRLIDMTNGFEFRLPLSQTDLSDAMGLSLVHVNRTLQQLRRSGLIDWQGEIVRILDWEALNQIAEFNDTYLNLEPEPR